MFELKKAALATLALTSQIAFAGTMGDLCNPIVSTVPCETRAWDLGITALYLDARLNREFSEATLTPGHIRYNQHNNWDWGFKLQGSYHYGTGNDININWYHYKNNLTYLGTYLNLINNPSSLFNVHYKPQWNAFNVELGQMVNFSHLQRIRFHGGMQFARVTNDIVLTDTAVAASALSRFTGIGPRFGADMAYALGYGLSIYANGATSLLVGTSGFNTFNRSTPLGIHTNGSKTTLTPELETKLGAAYNYMIDQGVFGLDVGYMWVNYFNSHQILTTEASDFALHGAYFGLTFTGNV